MRQFNQELHVTGIDIAWLVIDADSDEAAPSFRDDRAP